MGLTAAIPVVILVREAVVACRDWEETPNQTVVSTTLARVPITVDVTSAPMRRGTGNLFMRSPFATPNHQML